MSSIGLNCHHKNCSNNLRPRRKCLKKEVLRTGRVSLKTIAHLDLIILAKTNLRGHNKRTFLQKSSKMQSNRIKTLFKHEEKRMYPNKIMKIFSKLGCRVRSIHQSYQDSSFQKAQRALNLKTKMCITSQKNNKKQVLRKMLSKIIPSA